jgi:3-polyprenyl-4-hydroxybenzoate decarboxylase
MKSIAYLQEVSNLSGLCSKMGIDATHKWPGGCALADTGFVS